MNIGVLADAFITLSGAGDFLNNFLLGLSSKARKNKAKIFVFISSWEKPYKNYKGFKRLCKKIECKFSKFDKDCYILKSHPKFKNFENVSFVYYRADDIGDTNKILEKLNIDCVLLKTHDKMNFSMPAVSYLYDCQHKYYPEYFSDDEIKKRDEYFSVMSRDFCLVNSLDAKNDLIKFFNADSNKIFSLPFTPKTKEDFIKKDNSALIKKYNLAKRYFLSSNQFWLHKDHPTLFKAFAELGKNPKFKDVELVCTGVMEDYRKPEYIKELRDLIKNLGIENKVHLLGLIPKVEQMEIMKKAVAVVQTTLFEGGAGGGSIWDSCALGIRSIVSDIPINLEIDNRLVTFFEAKNENDLTQKMEVVLELSKPEFSKKELLKMNQENIEKLSDSLYDIILKAKKLV